MNKLRLFITLCLVFWGLVLIPFIAFTNEGQEPFQWYQVIDNGFGEGIGDVIELTGFKGYLYSSGWTGEKAQIWRTADGWNWERVNLEEQLELNTIYLLEVFDDYLYAGTVNRTTGAQLWRSPDGLNWELIVGNGFDHSNVGFYSMIEFNGYIYAGTWCDWGG
nr:hypothetical protein [Candidatus Aminicenantes bacterium]